MSEIFKDGLDAECERRAHPLCDCICAFDLKTRYQHEKSCVSRKVAAALKQMARDVRKECAKIARGHYAYLGDKAQQAVGLPKHGESIAAAIERAGGGVAAKVEQHCIFCGTDKHLSGDHPRIPGPSLSPLYFSCCGGKLSVSHMWDCGVKP